MPPAAALHRRTVLLGAGAVALAGALEPAAATAPTTPDDIKKAGVLRVGCEAVLPPFTFRQGGTVVGYDVDVAGLICEPLGVKPAMVDTAWAGVIPALYAGRFDIIMSQMTYTKERLEKVGFAIPYVDASLAMLVRAGDGGTLKSLDDLKGRAIGVELGSPGEIVAKQRDDGWRNAGTKGFSAVRIYDDYPAAYLALGQGSVDAVLNALPALAYLLKDTHGRFGLVPGIGAPRWAGIATRKENTELVSYLDGRMRELEGGGQLAALQEKWFGTRMNLPGAVPAL